MLKRFIRWMLPLMVLVLIAMYFVVSPMVISHAAGPSRSSIHIVAPQLLITQTFIFDTKSTTHSVIQGVTYKAYRYSLNPLLYSEFKGGKPIFYLPSITMA